MSHEFLTCPQCRFLLVPPEGQSSGVHCPRCNQWLALDKGCTGACLSCHKALKTVPVAGCGGLESIPVTLELSRDGSPRDASERRVEATKSGPEGWKRLVKGFFPVR